MRAAILCLAALAQLALNVAASNPITIPLFRRTDDGGIYKAAGQSLANGVVRLDLHKKKERYLETFSFFLPAFDINYFLYIACW